MSSHCTWYPHSPNSCLSPSQMARLWNIQQFSWTTSRVHCTCHMLNKPLLNEGIGEWEISISSFIVILFFTYIYINNFFRLKKAWSSLFTHNIYYRLCVDWIISLMKSLLFIRLLKGDYSPVGKHYCFFFLNIMQTSTKWTT